MANNLIDAKQELCDNLAAKIILGIPFIKRSTSIGRDQITKTSRTQGKIKLYVNAGGGAQVKKFDSNSALDLTNRSKDSSFYEKEFTASVASDILGFNAFEELFQLGEGGVDKEFVQPRGEYMSNIIEKDLVERNWFKAGGAVIENGGVNMQPLFKAQSILQTIKAGGTFTGFLSPMLQGELAYNALGKQNGFDAPTETQRDMYGNAVIGSAAGFEYINEPFMPVFTMGDALGSAKVAKAVNSGDDEIQLKGVTANAKIYKGTPLKIEGVYDVTMAGAPVVYKKTFIVQEDATVSGSGTVTVKIIPVYLTGDDHYKPTAYSTSTVARGGTLVGNKGVIPVDAGVTCELTAGTEYHIGLIREASAFNWLPFELTKLYGVENRTTSVDELTLHICTGGELLKYENATRIDCPYFGDIVDERACRTIYVKK